MVPAFLLRKLYLKGSLRKTEEGIAFDLKNVIGPGIVLQIVKMQINEHIFEPCNIFIDTDGKVIKANEISPETPILFSFLQKGTCLLKGAIPFIEGLNSINVEIISREAGLITVTITDYMQPCGC